MKDEKNVERVLQGRVRPVLWLGGAKEHIEEVSRITEVIVRIDEWHTQGVAIRKRRDRRNLSDEAVSLLFARLSAEDVFRVVIESGKRGDRRDHHSHRMGVVVEAIQKTLDAFVDEPVVRDVIRAIFQL